ncbi:MAG: hypothetical protein AAGA47_10490 [Pseudomonadota bacterium]
MDEMTLSPALATVLFVAACLAGMRYRVVWKAEGPRWQLWLFGAIAAVCLLTVGFIPLDV